MRVISVNVGLPREVLWNDKQVLTGIFKEPVKGPILMDALNLEGDAQADLSVHGGVDKAVYAYPAEHYAYWRGEGMDLPWGMFGENLTTQGLLEETTLIGDRFGIGEAEVMVTQPRLPCYKLGIKFGRDDIVKRFLASRRTGFYFSVVRGGLVGPGDEIRRVHQEPHAVSIADITRVFAFEKDDLITMRRAIEVDALPENWKSHLQHQIEKQTGS
jgi:MOSC domain-containing protein YiiM